MNGSDAMKQRLQELTRRLRIGLSVGVVLIVGAVALYTWATLNWAYSEGTRAGVLQKFDHKGWLCKTYEGELALYVVGGLAPQIWYFSVRDPKTVDALEQAVGQKVQLHYTEHRGVPSSCFAETQYFVDGVTVVAQP